MTRILISFIICMSCFAQLYTAPGPIQLKPFADKTGFTFMPDAVECLILKSTDGNYRETTCDYTMLWTAKIDGMKPILRNHIWGDYAYMTIRHPVGDAELSRFGNKIMFNDAVQDQTWIETNYDAEIPVGLILRLHYFTKSTVVDIDAIFNLRFHKVVLP